MPISPRLITYGATFTYYLKMVMRPRGQIGRSRRRRLVQKRHSLLGLGGFRSGRTWRRSQAQFGDQEIERTSGAEDRGSPREMLPSCKLGYVLSGSFGTGYGSELYRNGSRCTARIAGSPESTPASCIDEALKAGLVSRRLRWALHRS
jgi:hypothetical protein